MTQENVKIQIPFQSLVEVIASLGLEEKRGLWQLLEREIKQVEEESLEQEPYDWGAAGQPEGKPVEYVTGMGIVVAGGKE